MIWKVTDMAEYTEKLRKIASKLEPLDWEQEVRSETGGRRLHI